MMRVSTVAVMKKMASDNFKLKDVRFNDFEAIDYEEVVKTVSKTDLSDFEAQLEVWANLTLSYQGEPPDSYRVLNGMIQDWVEENEDDIKKIVNPKLIPYLKEQFKEIDTSDLQDDFDDYIWEDQVDYMPEVDEDKKEIRFTVELVLDIDESEEDE